MYLHDSGRIDYREVFEILLFMNFYTPKDYQRLFREFSDAVDLVELGEMYNLLEIKILKDILLSYGSVWKEEKRKTDDFQFGQQIRTCDV